MRLKVRASHQRKTKKNANIFLNIREPMEVLKRNNGGPLTSPDVLRMFSVCEKKRDGNKNLDLSNLSKFG